MNFNRYFNNQELIDVLNKWELEYPNLLAISNIGNSFEGRPIWVATITNKNSGLDLDKPAVWIDANIHATEISGTTTILYFMNYLLSNYGTDPDITNLLNNCTYYSVPRINPDGAELAMSSTPKFIRSGVRPYPWSIKEDGLHAEDIDGDGRILQMRIPDPNGDWKESSIDSRLLEKRSPDEYGGNYYRLMSEGLLENYDGFVIKSSTPFQGLDFNRNFPFEWRPESDQNGAGPYPASETEIKSVIDFIISHPNINIAITFHTYSRIILRPFSTKSDDELITEDLWVFKKIGEIGTKLTGYKCVSTFHDFKYHPKEVTTGAFDDWMYDHLGIYCYTIELWDLPTEAGIKDRKLIDWWREHPHEDDIKIIQWIDKHSPKDGYVDWYPYEHPQLGPIELGGWNGMYTWRNPPPDFIEKESRIHTPFLVSLGNLLPHLSIFRCIVSKVGENTYQVKLVVENNGFLPTFTSQQGKNRKINKPVQAEINLPEGVHLISGLQKQDLGYLEGRSNKLNVSPHMGMSPTDNRAKGEWILSIEQRSTVKIQVTSDRAGKLVQEITLE